ncbi:carbohydrate ABC transporter membrane protein 1, CUT1 family [Georgenia satyanarayanai]|uniref:Carbohydrate ABC transporter membrane protein 1, CUT1 family n=1 Tax=Georgenia satyanarayanai TaxID=860221 RepID=A0A2Y8ZXC2_9MICO|nr:sugar ABC transporter permease [Georgenia satyanarayanai]PYG01911.1 carbohydrate ABC transporter membrane protein 1 (CUT1 family) [Georgenia satyanarayanai]SSA36714.1 carbohydrate ABC transporter membrane protein 1, CUT1 family [Georgenia satyanarayanai]
MSDLTISRLTPEADARAELPPARPGRRGTWARRRRSAAALALVLPAAFFYVTFVLRPILFTVQYSLYDWNGVTEATWVGAENYTRLFSDPEMFGPILNALQLIVYFSFVPVALGLIAAAIIRKFATSRLAIIGRTVLFLPQVIPLVAAGIMWTWIMATDGVLNQFLRLIGLGSVTRAWLGDFDTALPGVGVIGAWVSLGLCLVLLLAGMSKIDPALYEAARLDGAGPIREFWSVTLPSLRQELAVCLTVTVIAALASFDIIYISTQGGPGNSTLVPGLEIYYLAFFQREVGQASALAVALMVLVLIVVIPLQRLIRGREQ